MKIEEYITPYEWSLTCKHPGCTWKTHGERTEDFINEMGEAQTAHENTHKEN